MKLVLEPTFGALPAHQIGMSTRILYIFGLTYLLQRYNPAHDKRDSLQVGFLWLGLTLLFEWGGSLVILRRPVSDILQGWQIWRGYMWPYVLLAYFCANLAVGLLLNPGRNAASEKPRRGKPGIETGRPRAAQ